MPALDPRVSVQVEITKRVSYFSALGLAHQAPSFLATFPGINVGGLDQGLQSSLQTSQGVDLKLPLDISVRASAFYTKYFGLTDATATCAGADFTNPATVTNSCIKNRVDGRAFGAELLVRRPFTKRFSGWLSYTLSRSTRETHNPFGPPSAVTEIPSEYDRTHVLTIAAAYDLGKRWRAGARFYYYTGRPYSPTIDATPVPPYDSERFPDFWRIDLRLERAGASEKWANRIRARRTDVTLNKEAVDLDCPSVSGTASPSQLGSLVTKRDQCSYEEIGPVSNPERRPRRQLLNFFSALRCDAFQARHLNRSGMTNLLEQERQRFRVGDLGQTRIRRVPKLEHRFVFIQNEPVNLRPRPTTNARKSEREEIARLDAFAFSRSRHACARESRCRLRWRSK